MKLPYALRLLTDAAITRRSATVGGHQSLPWIPGQCLLGAAAARLYPTLAREGLAWEAFHSGAMRFGDARPTAGGSPGWPVPLSFHHRKGEADIVAGHVSEHVVNALAHPLGGAEQWKQLREAYVALDGAVHTREVRRSMRTAVGAQGQAREGYLFELEAIPAGGVLCGVIEGPDALVTRVRDALLGQALRVGRSRSAEFGSARFEVVDCEVAMPRTVELPHQGTSVSYWCVSELCLRDADTGQPTFTPTAAQFGLPEGWRFDPTRSFVRTRRYTPFNAHRRAFDLERQVLCAGSVLSFTGDRNLDTAAWQRVLSVVAEGVGEYRAEGLGAVVFEPRLLASKQPVWEPRAPADTPADTPAEVKLPADALGRWLADEVAFHRVADAAWSAVRAQLEQMASTRRAWAAIPNAQWGELRALARRYRGRSAELAEELARHVGHVGDAEGGPGKSSQASSQARPPRGARARIWKDWRDGIQPAKAIVDWYRSVHGANPNAAPLALELLATHIVRAKKVMNRADDASVEGAPQ